MGQGAHTKGKSFAGKNPFCKYRLCATDDLVHYLGVCNIVLSLFDNIVFIYRPQPIHFTVIALACCKHLRSLSQFPVAIAYSPTLVRVTDYYKGKILI